MINGVSTTLSAQEWSGLVLGEYYQNTQTFLELAPVVYSKTRILRSLIETDSATISGLKGNLSGGAVRHTELSGTGVVLDEFRFKEPISKLDKLTAETEMNYNIEKVAMIKNAHQIALAHRSQFATAITNASLYSASNQYSTSAGAGPWDVPGTADPAADIQACYALFMRYSSIELTDPLNKANVVFVVTDDLVQLIQSTTSYRTYRNTLINRDNNVSIQSRIAAYADLSDQQVMVVPQAAIGASYAGFIYVQRNPFTFDVDYNNNWSTFLTGAMDSGYMGIQVQYAGAPRYIEKSFIGANVYDDPDGSVRWAQSWACMKVITNNAGAISEITDLVTP